MSRRDEAGCVAVIGYLLLFAILCYVVAAIAVYGLIVVIIGGIWAGMEAYRRSKGRPYVAPGQRFRAVWSRAVSPVDRQHWVTPQRRPATDPRLLPGQLTGALRVENLGVRRIDEPGPFEHFLVRARITNHGGRPVILGDLDHVDLQLWTPDGRVVGSDTTWSQQQLNPGYSCDATVAVRVLDHQPVASWAIGHRAAQARYVFFPAADPQPQEFA